MGYFDIRNSEHSRIRHAVKTKLIALGMLLSMLFGTFAGCSDNDFNAVLYSHANEWIDKDFLEDNRVKAYYLNENYVEGESDRSEKYIYDTNSPSSRVFIITEEDEYRKIFSGSHIDIDFEKEMVILYIFSNVNPYRKYYLRSIAANDKILTVQAVLEYRNGDDATMPYQRCFMLKMDKMEIAEVKFEL